MVARFLLFFVCVFFCFFRSFYLFLPFFLARDRLVDEVPGTASPERAPNEPRRCRVPGLLALRQVHGAKSAGPQGLTQDVVVLQVPRTLPKKNRRKTNKEKNGKNKKEKNN